MATRTPTRPSTRSSTGARKGSGRGNSTGRRQRGISDATVRIQLRRRRSRLRAALRWGIAVVLVAAVGAGVWLVGFSSVLSVRQVTVTGTTVADPDRVRDTAGIVLGTPLARIDSGAVEQRVGSLAPVKSVQLERHWPDRVTIVVTERTPVLAVRQNNSTGILLVDAEGVPFTEVTSVPTGMVVASTPKPELLAPLATVVTSLPPALAERTTEISAETQDSIELSVDGKRVIWGSVERSDFKATVLVALMKQEGSVYDVSAPDHPAVR
ncbi:cell division protein FtsQ/DivIB [Propionibacteriaceae bacterium Y2011]|uniref:cell division protein FtsQ/DivIB n=1 Tax=Microlunatus sp. Y2014 TaxID=3418488 RepID=UPI003B4EED13